MYTKLSGKSLRILDQTHGHYAFDGWSWLVGHSLRHCTLFAQEVVKADQSAVHAMIKVAATGFAEIGCLVLQDVVLVGEICDEPIGSWRMRVNCALVEVCATRAAELMRVKKLHLRSITIFANRAFFCILRAWEAVSRQTYYISSLATSSEADYIENYGKPSIVSLLSIVFWSGSGT